MSKSIDIKRDYRACRFLEKGSITAAQNRSIAEKYIERNNKWNMEAVRG